MGPDPALGAAAGIPIDVIGSYRFDDPDGRVGMETHLVDAGGTLLQVPLTYRDEPLDGRRRRAHHRDAALGARHPLGVRRAARPAYVVMLAGVAMTGQGEALGMAVYDGRWYIAPTNVRIQGGGWTQERVPVDGFELGPDDATEAVLRNDRFELTVFRRPVPGLARPSGSRRRGTGSRTPSCSPRSTTDHADPRPDTKPVARRQRRPGMVCEWQG